MSKKKKEIKRFLNVIVGMLIFVFLIGSAFAIDWIFGLGFVINFSLAIYNKVLEKNFLIPLFIFIGALIIRYALFVFLSSVLGAQSYFSLGISLLLFVALLFLGWKIKRRK